MKKTSILILLALMAFGQMAWAQWNGSGTEANPYRISTVADWNTLATNVNNGNNYSGKFFKLMNNIAYDYTGAANENNYTAIGGLYHSFNGHFDGNNKTVSGVRIYNDSDYQGLFGPIEGEVKNLTLDDAIIVGGSRTGGIVGQNNGNVTNCRVTSSVTVSGYEFFGGIVGFNYGTVSQCTSSVTLTKRDNNRRDFGAIAGINGSYGTLSDNLAIGATVPAASGNYHGAIVGTNDYGTLERNYYRNCTVAGVVNAIRVGCAGADVTDNNGALSLHTLTLGNGITASAPTINYDGVGYYARTNTVTLACTIPAPVGYHYVYLVDGEAVSGDTFAMPGTDATITTTIAYTLDYEHITSSDSREFYRFNYPSTSVTGEPVLLSSALVFWKSSSMQDSIQAVHLCCHHTFTANSECPSMSVRPVSLEANSFMASSMTGGGGGLYSSVVIMPDYEGFGVSSDRTHPYLAEEVTAQQTVDAMTFGLQVYQHLVDEGSALALSNTWRSFTLGYSQGGAVALATHRYIEQHNLYHELHFRGSLCGDGPYDLITTLQYYLFDNGTSYEVTTDHREGQCTLPVVIPMIMRGMMLSDPYAGSHSLSDYLSQQFLDTGILDWLDSKTMSTDDIAGAWKQQLTDGFTAANGTTYTHEQMLEMFIDKSTSSTPMVWAKLNKVFTPGFYAYLTDPSNFNSVPTATGDPYQDMHRALANNGLCTGWNPSHRIQFKHSKQDMVVPYGNYLAYKDAHDGEDTRYRVDNSFSTSDHQGTGILFFLGLKNWNDVFQWLDGSPLEWSGSGTEEDPYMINNTDEWQLLVDSVSNGNTYSGKFFRLGDDISVTTMVGISGKTFNGIFDGDGHTLTINYTTNAEYCGPFCYTYGATIKNLRTTGTINTSNIRAGGVVGRNGTGNLVMTSVTSSVTINSTYSGSAQHGGLVGYTINADLTGCAFTGSLLGENSNGCGGLIGWKTNTDNSRVNITNCFFAPTSVTVGTDNAYTMAKNSSGGVVNVNNSYYTQALGTAQGKQAHSITGTENVIVAFAGDTTGYDVSGITSYGTGIKYNNVLYAGNGDNGDNVSLNLDCTLPEGCELIGYQASAGTLTGSNNPYTLTMPNEDVTITVRYLVEWSGDGESWETAYLIYTPEQLDLLATRVNGENSSQYNTKYYKLMADLEYDADVADNFTAIGTTIQNQFDHSFNGHFDGQGHTISGINSISSWVYYNGLFGKLESGAEVKNIVLANCNIGDGERAGGIAGWNDGTITNCRVTSSVTVNGTNAASAQHGGIVGANSNGIVSHCIFEGTLTKTFSNPNPEDVIIAFAYGGIAGINNTNATLSDNFVAGAVIPATMHGYGAVVGLNNGTLNRNYYIACTVNGVANATGVGYATVSGRDIVFGDATDNDGAIPGNVRTITAPTAWNSQNPDGWAFIASPLIDDIYPSSAAVENIFSATDYDLYRLNPSNTRWENWKEDAGNNNAAPGFYLENGRGYLYATQVTETIVFNGNARDYNLSDTTEVVLGQGFNLVGNPFPRAAYINRSYYTLNSDGSAIETNDAVSSSIAISPCTAVIVQATNANDIVTFTTTAPGSVGAAPNNGNLHITLSQVVEPVETPVNRGDGPSTSSGTLTLDNAIVSFNEGSELGKFYFGHQDANIYIPQGNEDYAIAFSDKQGEMPLNFKTTEDGTYTITVNPKGVEMTYLHLIDNMTGADVDLLALRQAQGPASYTFTAKTTDYESRFKLVFSSNGEDGPSTGSGAFAFVSNGNIIVNGEGMLQIIDVMGRIIVTRGGRIQCVPTSRMTPGVYVLRLIDGNGVRTQKIVIE